MSESMAHGEDILLKRSKVKQHDMEIYVGTYLLSRFDLCLVIRDMTTSS